MKAAPKYIFFIIAFLASFICLSYAQNLSIPDLADKFQAATDLQRKEIVNGWLGKAMQASGKVLNVEEYNFFDEKNDKSEKYYRVTTDTQKTPNNTPYQVIFLYKNLDTVQGLSKGQLIERDGSVIGIVDERLQIAVWLYVGDLTEKEKDLFNN